MITVYADDHRLHRGLLDPRGETWRASSECPERADNVVKAIREQRFGTVIEPDQFDDAPITRIHTADYLEFLKNVWPEWLASDEQGANARPETFVGPGMRHVESDCIAGKLGRYSFDSTTPFVEGSFKAIRTSANIALTAAGLLQDGQRHAFALCRPPGHHATQDCCGGYCYLNNTALAAQKLLDGGAGPVAVLDVDYHHGNGTQTIFYERSDVLTISLHADPKLEYPFFAGFADETGAGNGRGYNYNYPLPFGTDWASYQAVLDEALDGIRRFSPAVLLVALGLDTFVGDPTTHFAITTDDFRRMGERIATLALPTLVVLEGGYSVEHIGENTVNFLKGLAAK
ncbi:MAG: histone deacetylase family protein [Woeseiaceae bacterium]|nr:histone deacetylase family protein [Woeseiaceae bacterium]